MASSRAARRLVPLALMGAALCLLAWAAILPAETVAQPFADVPEGAPYGAAIDRLEAAGIVDGYPQSDGRVLFMPERGTVRAQLAKTLVELSGLPVAEGEPGPFVDLGRNDPDSLYPHEYVAVAARLGVTHGLDASHFGPYAPVSRAQAVSMAVRFLDWSRPGSLATPDPGFSSTWGEFHPAHASAARRAEYGLLLAGLPLESLSPWAPMTRGELAQLLANALGVLEAPGVTRESGLFGLVTLGPVLPVEQYGSPNWRPYAGTVVVKTALGGHEVARVHSDAQGVFRVGLEAGTYLVESKPDDVLPPFLKARIAVVEPRRWMRVDLPFDTGIRFPIGPPLDASLQDPGFGR